MASFCGHAILLALGIATSGLFSVRALRAPCYKRIKFDICTNTLDKIFFENVTSGRSDANGGSVPATMLDASRKNFGEI